MITKGAIQGGGSTWRKDPFHRGPSQSQGIHCKAPNPHHGLCSLGIYWVPLNTCAKWVIIFSLRKYSSPPCEHGVGHEPWQVLLLLVEHELEVVAWVALMQRQRHRLELLLALQGVQVHVEDARPEQRNY